MDLMNYIDRGGVIVLILIGLNIIGWSIMLVKFFQLTFINSKKLQISNHIVQILEKTNQNFLNQTLQNSLENQIKSLEGGLNIIKIIASIAPLLGLLGTVVGVLSAFDSIAQNGLGQTSVFASGISVALITTIAGLIVAIPHIMGYNYFISRIDKIELEIQKEILEKI